MTGMNGSVSTTGRKSNLIRLCRTPRTWLVFGLVAALFTLTACGGGGFNDNNGGGGPSTLIVTITGTSTVSSAMGDSAVKIDFTVQGDAGQAFGLLFQYFIDTNMNGVRDGGESLLNMTEVSMALESILGLTSDGDLSSFPSGQSMVSGSFLWQAGADLGFVGTSFGVVITPSTAVTGQSVTPGTTNTVITYNSGNAPASFSGSIGAGGVAGNGRAEHTGALVSDLGATAIMSDLGNEILVVGGTDGSMDLSNIDRFSVDGNTRTVNASGNFNAANVRRNHASASYFAGSAIRVLVCGGAISGTATNTADVYTFGPSGAESVSSTGAMNSARSQHSACWLPDNRIFVHGGFNAMGAAQSSAEIYNPAMGTFSALTVPGSVPARVAHTCCVLPNGQVLIAGGHNGSNVAVNAFLYDPKTDTWTDTGSQIDRVGHTATMLVNGICALIGGRTNAGATLNTATFYRTFAESGGIPAGFTTIAMTALSSARAEHGASRLADGSVLVSGGFGSSNSTLATSEVFIPSKFTDPAIGFFTQTNPGAVANMDLLDSRARHTQTTTASGSAAVIGGVTGTTASNTVLDTIEVFQFQNSAPSVSGITASGGLSDVSVNFSLTDAEGDCSFVILRYSTDGGVNFNFATLTDYRGTVNLAPGARTIHWNAAADGIGSLTGVTLEIIPVGGVVGAPARTTL